MSDDTEREGGAIRPVEEPGRPGLLKTWRGEVTDRAKVRRAKVQNELGEELVKYHDLQTQLAHSQRALAEAQEANTHLDVIKDTAAKRVQAESHAADVHLKELENRGKQLDAEADGIVARFNAGKAEDETRRLDAESAALDKQIEIAQKKKKLAEAIGDTTAHRQALEAELSIKREALALAEAAEMELNDPKYDGDERHPHKLRTAQEQTRKVEQEIAVLEQQIATLS